MKKIETILDSRAISSLNDLLEARELTGKIPETMPTGLRIRENNESSDCYAVDCHCRCDCGNDCDPDNQCVECNCNCSDCCTDYCNCDH